MIPLSLYEIAAVAGGPPADKGKNMSAVHDVPICRQRIDPDKWDEHGGHALGDRAEWSERACGMAALRMIMLAYLGTAPPLTELLKLGVEAGAAAGTNKARSPPSGGRTVKNRTGRLGCPAHPQTSGLGAPIMRQNGRGSAKGAVIRTARSARTLSAIYP
jgi:hypothetical protein